jgi:hypothetical protein
MIGPIYRESPMTVEDYDEAIEDLEAARDCLEQNGYSCACGDCGMNDCRHNPLAMARFVVTKLKLFRCYHCGETFEGGNDADEHFGTHAAMKDKPICCE